MPRRSPGEGSVSESRPGSWIAQITLADGRRKSGRAPTRAAAVQKLREFQIEEGLINGVELKDRQVVKQLMVENERLRSRNVVLEQALIDVNREMLAYQRLIKGEQRPRRPIALSVRLKILERDNYRCRLCGQSASDEIVLHIDHRVAVAKGGKNDIENLWTLCNECNHGKHTKDMVFPEHVAHA